MDACAFGAIAQLVEHLNGIEGVSGSSPLSSIPKYQFLLGLNTFRRGKGGESSQYK